MKKSFKSRIKKWKIGDYIRQFSIVVGGVLLTLWLTDYIAEASKQKEVRQAMQLVRLELQDNLQTLHNYKEMYSTEKRIALRLQEDEFSTADIPDDSVMFYKQRLYGGLAKPLLFSTNALEMLKASGLTPYITDKRLVIDLLHCYKSIETFDTSMELYFNMRKEILSAYIKENSKKTILPQQDDFRVTFRQMTADPDIQNWLYIQPRSFDVRFFDNYKKETEETISKLETAYQQ